MKQLTLKDKQKIVEMLNKYYTIDAAAMAIIDMATDNAEQVTELTLKAFSIFGKPKVAKTELVQENNFEFQTVQIDYVDGKLTLIKAIKETTHLRLAECKAIADQIISFGKDGLLFNPFRIGVNNKVYTFTVNQWTAICKYLHDNYGTYAIKWHYV